MNVCKNKKWLSMITIFILLFLGFYSNIASRVCYHSVKNFDWWSNDILLSDMMYAEHYKIDKMFLYAVTPDMLCPDDYVTAEGIIPEMFSNGDYFEKDFYKQYTSNIVVQRYLYRFIVTHCNISHEVLLKIFYISNCLLAALVITLIFAWINTFADGIICIIAAFILAFVCPLFSMYGKNLYWSMWTLFFPMACMAFAVTKGILEIENKRKKNGILFLIAYMTCTVKLAFCFEFMTAVMVAMTIPLFYVCFREKNNLKDIILKILWPFIGAMLSFATVFGIKLAMLISQFGSQNAFQIINHNLGSRIFGTIANKIESKGPILISIRMLSMEFMSVKGVFKITFCAAVAICIGLVILYCFMRKRCDLFSDKEYVALMWTTCLSLCAPFSWFVMAAPHTTVHDLHCSINWFIPFCILFIILVLITIKKLIYIFEDKEKKNA